MYCYAVLYLSRLWRDKCKRYEIDESILRSSCRRPSGAVISNQWKQVSQVINQILCWTHFAQGSVFVALVLLL